MTGTPSYAAQLAFWLVVYGLAGYGVRYVAQTLFVRRQVRAHVSPRAKPKRRR